MPAVGMLLLVIGLLVALVGPIRPSLFGRKGQAPKRRELFFMGVGAAAIGLVVVGVTAERPVGPNAEKVEAEPDKPAGTQAAAAGPRTAPEGAAKPAPVTASKPAIEIPAGAVAKYCADEAKKIAIIRESDRLFPPLPASAGLDAMREHDRKSEEWRTAQYEPLNKELEAALGLDRNKIIYLATEHQWAWKCRALEAGKPFLDTAEVLAATDDDWRTVERAFKENLYKVYPGASGIECKRTRAGEHRIVGCRTIKSLESGPWLIAVAGRSTGGEVLIAGVNGTARTRIEKHSYLTDANNRQVKVGMYVGPSIDVAGKLD